MAPAIDEDGNVVFTGGGGGLAGVYTAAGYCCQIVADTQTPVPGGGGATFYDFSGAERHDIDGGRVAFTAMEGPYHKGVYSNVGQASASTLRKIAEVDDIEWSELGDPWVDGNTVSIYGMSPSQSYEILLWDGSSSSTGFLNPGGGFNTAYDSQASISDDAAVFLRFGSGKYEMAVSMGSSYESLATADVTQMPGMGGDIFRNFYHHPVVDRGGLDVAFLGYGDFQGLFKRVDLGPLEHVADNSMYVPGSKYERFTLIEKNGIALANGQVVFQASTTYLEQGIYTDIGGQLATVVDTGSNDTIVVNGQTLRVSGLSLGTRGFAYGPDGYMVVFRASLATGGTAIIRATITDNTGGGVDGAFTVYKDYSDNNSDWVSVTASCSSGTVVNNPQQAREGTPAVFQVTGALPGATCTAAETSVATGYTKDESDCQDGDPLNGSCTLVNTLNPPPVDTFTVYKDFSDDNAAWVSVALTCTSGTVTNSPQWAREGTPAVFEISGALATSKCRATETKLPTGYSKDESDCQNGDPLNGSCTLVNTLDAPSSNTFTVYKDFSDNNSASVGVTLSCTSGTVTNNPQAASESAPAVFQISGATAGTTCTAVESSLPSGYTKDESDCQNGDPLDGSCTLVNTLDVATTNAQFTVYKDFSDDNAAWVYVRLTCTSGTVTNSPRWGREGTPIVFDIEGATPGTTCTAEELRFPDGYTKDESDCQNGDPLNGSCTLVNSPVGTSVQTFTVYKDFDDNNADSVSVSLSCGSGTVVNNPQWASEASPAVFEVAGAAAGTTCTAVENQVPDGYSADQSDCQDGDPLGSSCVIVNTANPSNNTFTVYKDFSDGNPASVSISLSCTSGSVSNTPQLASEGSPAVFSISGAAAGTTCSAVENPVPSGYTANPADCQDGDGLDGSCTIVNTLNQQPDPNVIFSSSFDAGDTEGWSLNSGAKIDSSNAMGAYSLMLENDGASAQRGVSTAGFTDVSVTMHIAGESLEKNDSCFAELSTNGGGNWSTVASLTNGEGNRTFSSATVSPAAASDNTNLRLRYRLVGKGKGDYCWGDEIIVRGTPASGLQGEVVFSAKAQEVARSGLDSVTGDAAPSVNAFGRRGFDPGFDQLIGDGSVMRTALRYNQLSGEETLPATLPWSAFELPAGAAQPTHVLEGVVQLAGTDGSGLGTAPSFSVEFVQIGNHLFPQSQVWPSAEDAGWAYVIDTGRVWLEDGDRGYSRAAIPFLAIEQATGCVREGAATFLFDDRGAASEAAMKLAAGDCGAALSGLADVSYTPASAGSGALELQQVLSCASDSWLPAVQGKGGLTLLLLPDNSLQFVLSGGGEDLWLDAGQGSGVTDELCD